PSQTFFGGSFCGIANVLAGQPFDTIKAPMQTTIPGQYRGIFYYFKKTIAEDGGLKALDTGVSGPLIG
ncbi:hypothetical protein BJ741DRAFT_531195, partial [Chytriomyces cf. hyalinus JEL632]